MDPIGDFIVESEDIIVSEKSPRRVLNDLEKGLYWIICRVSGTVRFY